MPCSTPPTGSSIRSIHALPQEPTFIWQRWESGGSSFRSGWLDHQRIHQPKICTYLFHVFFGVPLATIYAHIVLWRRYRKPRTSPGCTHTYVNMWYSQSWKMESQHWLWDTLGTCAVQSKTISMGVSEMGPHLEAVLTGDSDGGFKTSCSFPGWTPPRTISAVRLCGISWNIEDSTDFNNSPWVDPFNHRAANWGYHSDMMIWVYCTSMNKFQILL